MEVDGMRIRCQVDDMEIVNLPNLKCRSFAIFAHTQGSSTDVHSKHASIVCHFLSEDLVYRLPSPVPGEFDVLF